MTRVTTRGTEAGSWAAAQEPASFFSFDREIHDHASGGMVVV